jgi:hypothetical protein
MLIRALAGVMPVSFRPVFRSSDLCLVVDGYDDETQQPMTVTLTHIPGCATAEERNAWILKYASDLQKGMELGLCFTGLNHIDNKRPSIESFSSFRLAAAYAINSISMERNYTVSSQGHLTRNADLVAKFVQTKVGEKPLQDWETEDFNGLDVFLAERYPRITQYKSAISQVNILMRYMHQGIDGFRPVVFVPGDMPAGTGTATVTDEDQTVRSLPLQPDDEARIIDTLTTGSYIDLRIPVLLMRHMMLDTNDIRGIRVQDVDLDAGMMQIRTLNNLTMPIPRIIQQELRPYSLESLPPTHFLVGKKCNIGGAHPFDRVTFGARHGRMMGTLGFDGSSYTLHSYRSTLIGDCIAAGMTPAEICEKYHRSNPHYIAELVAKFGFVAKG